MKTFIKAPDLSIVLLNYYSEIEQPHRTELKMMEVLYPKDIYNDDDTL